MPTMTTYHALSAEDGRFLAEIELEESTGVAEIVTTDDSFFAIVFKTRELINEVAAYLGIDDSEVYLTDADESRIVA